VPDESKGGSPKKMSTRDILAAARAQAGGAAPAQPSAPAPAPAPLEPAAAKETAPATPAVERPAAEIPAAKPAAAKKPGSTADILSAARAQAAGGSAAATTGTAPKTTEGVKPAAAKKVGSTADILAAARAQAAGGAAASAPAAAPVAKATKPAAAAKAVPAASGPVGAGAGAGAKLSVQEMLAAVRPGGIVESPAAPAAAKPAKPAGPPPMPQKPIVAAAAAPRPAPPPDRTRRNIVVAILLAPFALIAGLFSSAFAASWTLLAATTGIATLATARFMLPNVITEPPRKFKIGPPADFDLGTVATKLVAQYGVWIIHTDGYKGKNLIYALISVCTHLGCTPSWLEGERKFKCPCHGSGFYITGINFEGPAPRPLERAGIRLSEDGMLEVDKSIKFQEEMGQWSDPASYYEVIG
jgi:cytochrome b6-f complex iron-sulfur subunit